MQNLCGASSYNKYEASHKNEFIILVVEESWPSQYMLHALTVFCSRLQLLSA